MIAKRMRPIGWVAGVATAALSFYLVSLQVAGERAALESVERKIVNTQRQVRQLETEFSARASLRQLEAYNDDVLALAAPKVDQYLTNEVQLASYTPSNGGDIGKPAAATALASAEAAPPAAKRPVLRQAVVTDAKSDNAPVIPAMKRPPLIQAVAMLQDIAPRKLAPPPIPLLVQSQPRERVSVLDDAALKDLARAATREARGKTQ